MCRSANRPTVWPSVLLLAAFLKTASRKQHANTLNTALPWVLSHTSTSAMPPSCLFRMGQLLATFLRTAHPNNFTLPWFLSNKSAKCEVDRMNGCRENRITDIHTYKKSFHYSAISTFDFPPYIYNLYNLLLKKAA